MLFLRRDRGREARRLSGGNSELRSYEEDEKAESNCKREYSSHTNPPQTLLSPEAKRRRNDQRAMTGHPKV